MTPLNLDLITMVEKRERCSGVMYHVRFHTADARDTSRHYISHA